MIPYKDDNPTERTPYVTITIIALNVIIHLWSMFSNTGRVAHEYGAVPASLLGMGTNQPIHPGLTIFTSMFLHGGLLHLGGNMLYMWIFGNNIEDRLGPVKFILFYLGCGLVAAYSHAIIEPTSTIPMIGASGAVAGVLGAYLLLFPRAGVYTIVIFVFFVKVIRLPALIVIGFWAIIQLVNGVMSAGLPGGGGVAWFAHIGGFVFGVVVIKMLVLNKRRRRKQWS
jgi:membrane associated rhomboid family serine protease